MGSVVNPFDRERAAKVREIQDKAIKIVTSKRNTIILFKDGSKKEFTDPVTVSSEGAFYTVYVEETGKIHKFPIETIQEVEETLNADK